MDLRSHSSAHINCHCRRGMAPKPSLEIRFATEEVSSCQQPQVAEHGRE